MNAEYKIPVFYHIYKCAGTYALVEQLKLFNLFKVVEKNGAKKHVMFIKNGLVVLRILLLDVNNYFGDSEEISVEIDINFLEEVINSCILFSVIIPSGGEVDVLKYLPKNTIEWTIIRDPFSWSKSVYYYTSSEQSSHENYHKMFHSKTFEEHLLSEELPYNQYIKVFSNDESLDLQNITESQYKDLMENVKNIRFFDIKESISAINQIFKECHEFDLDNVPESINKLFEKKDTNKTINLGNEKLEDMSLIAQENFLKRNQWNFKFYLDVIK
jgi:hypothetical protein